MKSKILQSSCRQRKKEMKMKMVTKINRRDSMASCKMQSLNGVEQLTARAQR